MLYVPRTIVDRVESRQWQWHHGDLRLAVVRWIVESDPIRVRRPKAAAGRLRRRSHLMNSNVRTAFVVLYS